MQIELLAAFSYLWAILDNYDVIKQYLIDGGRKAAKTTQVVKWVLLIALSRKRINVLGIRKINDDAKYKLSELFISVLNQFNQSYKHFNGKQRIILKNGNYIDYKGATGQNGQPKFSGYAVDNDPEYIVVLVDEAYELTKKEWYGVYEGVRTDTSAKIIFIRMSNNWKAVNWYVKLLNTLLKFRYKELRKNGEQIKIKDNKLIHHCNIKVNHFLPEDEVEKLIDTYLEDEERGKVSLWGLPGTLEGAVYNDDSDKYSRQVIPFGRPIEYSIGINLKDKRSKLGMTLNAFYKDYNSVATLKEFSISSDFEDPFVREEERNKLIIDQIEKWFYEINFPHYYDDAKNEKFDIYNISVVISSDGDETSLSALTMHLQELLEERNQYLAEDVDFTLPIKYKPEEHIDLMKTLMTSGNYICIPPRTLAQLDSSPYPEGDKTRRDDEGFDELICSIENSLSLRRNSIIN